MNFETAVEKVLKFEGGYSNHPKDRGGPTRYGITEVVARKNGYDGDMRDFPQPLAKIIYKHDYWNIMKCDQLPEKVRYAVFDAGINSGISRSVQWLQECLNVKADLVIGPITLKQANLANPDELVRKLIAKRLKYLSNLASWNNFGKGWVRRLCAILEE